MIQTYSDLINIFNKMRGVFKIPYIIIKFVKEIQWLNLNISLK